VTEERALRPGEGAGIPRGPPRCPRDPAGPLMGLSRFVWPRKWGGRTTPRGGAGSSCSLRHPRPPRARDRPCSVESASRLPRLPGSPAVPEATTCRAGDSWSARLSPGLKPAQSASASGPALGLLPRPPTAAASPAVGATARRSGGTRAGGSQTGRSRPERRVRAKPLPRLIIARERRCVGKRDAINLRAPRLARGERSCWSTRPPGACLRWAGLNSRIHVYACCSLVRSRSACRGPRRSKDSTSLRRTSTRAAGDHARHEVAGADAQACAGAAQGSTTTS